VAGAPENPVDHEARQMAGSRKLAEELKRNLETLRDRGSNSPLADMARDVLEGRMSLRDVARSSAFAVPLSAAMDRFHDYDAQLSPEERVTLLKDAEERLADNDE
jgi:hypothetical protein